MRTEGVLSLLRATADVSEVRHVWSFFKRLTWGSRFTNCNLPKYILGFEMVFSFGDELV